ncbi:MAG: hypothetical protein ABI904_13370 [Chloroflexota bacterium]
MKLVRRSLIAVGILVAIVLFSWGYTSIQLSVARSRGVYDSPEQGMLALMDKYYTADKNVKMLYAGTNSFDGSNPHVWYVIAEVRAKARADGSELGSNGCEAPGSFFLQTKEGWVHVKEQAFPTYMGFWMKVFRWAGEGKSKPSTNWGKDQNPQFCR